MLVHGGTSGIGVTAIQFAKAFGAKVIATAGSAEKCAAACVSSAPTLRSTTALKILPPAVKDDTGGRGADVILDMVGGDYIDKNIRALADDGRLVNHRLSGGIDGVRST